MIVINSMSVFHESHNSLYITSSDTEKFWHELFLNFGYEIYRQCLQVRQRTGMFIDKCNKDN